MPIIWDKERISKLTLQELKNLRTNAIDSGRSEIVELIDEEVKTRPSPRARSTKVRAHNIPRSQFETLGQLLIKTYDLSEETARQLSEGANGYRYHSLLGKDGKAKTGGAKKQGTLKLDEYMSYRVGNDAVNLSLVQFPDDPDDLYRYHVLTTSKEVLTEPVESGKIRPDWEGWGFATQCYGQEFGDFESASEVFVSALSSLVPKR